MNNRLHVGNLSYDTTEDTIAEVFGRDSREVTNVTIAKKREKGASRGFAFVEMVTEGDASAAIAAVDGTEVDGRMIRVTVAKQPLSASRRQSY